MGREELELRKRAGWISLAVGIAVFGGKLAAWQITNSTAVFSDAMESIVNVAAAGLLVLSLRIAARPADRDHPYGHGRVEFFSAGIEGACITVAAVLIGVEAGRELFAGPELHRLDAGLGLLLGLSLANAALGVYLIRSGERTHSAALVADGRHILTDVWTSGGVIVGIGAVSLTGWLVLDPLIALAVALNILREGWRLLTGAVRDLMDAADESVLAPIAAALDERREPSWIDVHSLRAWKSGAQLHVDFHLSVPRYFDAEALHGIHERLERILREATEQPCEVIVHFDPCRPRECAGCAMPECPVRETPLATRPPLTVASTTRDDQPVERLRGSVSGGSLEIAVPIRGARRSRRTA